MERGTPIFIVLGIVALLFFVNPTQAQVGDNLFGCLDYDYKLDFKEVEGIDMTFFTVQDGEQILFKDDFTPTSEISTLLHCGHDYHAVYRAEGYKDFEEDFTIANLMPMVSKFKIIKMEKI